MLKKRKSLVMETCRHQFITKAKETTFWLKEVASTPLQQSLNDLDKAYQNFFESRSG
jgi:putative transposase